jgi:heme-degrading monooxygenase HmoA
MYVCIWAFRVAADARNRFETAYGPDGPWVALFRKARGYRETWLCRDRDQAGRYVTVDVWESRDVYDAFRHAFAAEYARIDAECAALTQDESPLGEFDTPHP